MMDAAKFCVGENFQKDGSAEISNSVIWDDVKIGKNVKLNRTIIADGVRIKDDETYENAAIVRADMLEHCKEIPQKAMKGEIIGENYVVSLNQ